MEVIFTTEVNEKPYSVNLPYPEDIDYETILTEFELWNLLMQRLGQNNS